MNYELQTDKNKKLVAGRENASVMWNEGTL